MSDSPEQNTTDLADRASSRFEQQRRAACGLAVQRRDEGFTLGTRSAQASNIVWLRVVGHWLKAENTRPTEELQSA